MSFSKSDKHESSPSSYLNATRVSSTEAESQGQPGTQNELAKNLQQVIRLCDQLKDCGIQNRINLPTIIAIGAQSAGKSSLIESLVGFSFLPRGSGMVTKRPLSLQMERLKDVNEKPYAIFPENPVRERIAIEEIEPRIAELMSEKFLEGKVIHDEPIKLKIFSPRCPDLSLLDLPGITKLSDAHKNVNLEEITTNLTTKYAKEKRTIILCVTEASRDIGNSEAIQISRRDDVDPHGLRSLGVLTKADKAEGEEGFLNTLKNKVIELHHGYVAIRNRGPNDSNLSIEECLIREKEYFDSRPEFKGLQDSVGNNVLAAKLSRLLYDNIMTSLPDIKADIEKDIKDITKRLVELGEPLPTDPNKMLLFLNRRITYFSGKLQDVMKGEVSIMTNKNEEQVLKEKAAFQGESQLRLLIGKFKMAKDALFQDAIDDLNKDESQDVHLSIMEAKGVFVSGFLPKKVMKRKVRKALDNLKEETEKFVMEVQELNQIMLRHTLSLMHELSADNKGIIARRANDHLEKRKQTTLCLIEEILNSEAELIWTDEDYSLQKNKQPDQPKGIIEKAKEALSDFFMTKKKEALEEAGLDLQEVVKDEEVLLLRTKVENYFKAMKFTLGDTLVKLIGAKLFKTFCPSLQQCLCDQLEDIRTEFENARHIDPIEAERVRLTTDLENLKKARTIIGGFFF